MVGTGGMANLIVNDFHQTENVDLVAVVSRTQQRAEAYAVDNRIAQAFGSLAPVLEDPTIDGVYVASPHPMHLASAVAALEAGKHVLVEKPMTMTASDSRALLDLAQSKQRFAMEAMWMAFNPTIRDVLDMVTRGALGQVHVVIAEFGAAFPFKPEGRLWKKELGGGTVLDQGIYPISLAHLLFGAPASVRAMGSIGETDVDIEAAMTLEYGEGQRALLISSMRASLPSVARVCGTDGFIEIAAPFWSTDTYCVTAGPRVPDVDVTTHRVPREGRGYVPMLRAVSQAIDEGRTEHPWWTHADTLAVADVMDEALAQIRG